jgi:hypothetical protein
MTATATNTVTVTDIAHVAHEANRAYCATMGDLSQPKWQTAPDWQRKSAITGVRFHLDHLRRGQVPPASASHESWLEEKKRDGWRYGPVKRPDLKEHPCFVPYAELPPEQKVKDYLFGSVVKAYFDSGIGILEDNAEAA